MHSNQCDVVGMLFQVNVMTWILEENFAGLLVCILCMLSLVFVSRNSFDARRRACVFWGPRHLGWNALAAMPASSSRGPKEPGKQGRKPAGGASQGLQEEPAKPKRRSGKSNWVKHNQQRQKVIQQKKRRKQGLPVTRLRAKQTVRPLSKGRTTRRAKRVEEPEGQVELESKATQTDAQFYTLADLPDTPYEESESGQSFLDDVNLSPCSEDGFWSEKAYSI